MNILLVHQFYLRPGQGGGSRFNEMVRVWREHGHDVTVCAGQVDYTSGHRPERWRSGKLWHVEHGASGERVLRFYTPDTYQAGRLGRGLAVGGFAGAVMLYLLANKGSHDVAVVTSPPLTLGVLPYLLRVPCVFEVRDLWPESAVATGALREGSVATRALYLLESFACRHADRVVALTPAIAQSITARGLCHDVTFIPNGADASMLDMQISDAQRDATRAELGWTGKFVVLYAGAHGAANDLMQWVDAATLTREDSSILWVAVGEGPQKAALMQESEQRGLHHIQWLCEVDRARITRYFDAADCGAAVLKRSPTFKTVYPNKIFDAMSRARPVLCGVDGAARDLVEAHGAGVFFEPERPQHMVERVRWLKDNPERASQMGRRGRALVLERFSRPVLAHTYLELLQDLLDP